MVVIQVSHQMREVVLRWLLSSRSRVLLSLVGSVLVTHLEVVPSCPVGLMMLSLVS